MPKSMKNDSKASGVSRTYKKSQKTKRKFVKRVIFSLTLSQEMNSMKVVHKKYPKTPKAVVNCKKCK